MTTEIDFESIEFGKPYKKEDGKYFIAIKNIDKDVLVNLGRNVICKSKVKATLDVKLSEQNTINMIENAEEIMLLKTKENKEEWFPNIEGMTDEYLEQAMMKFIKRTKNNCAHFRMRTSSKLIVYNSKKEEIAMDNINEGTNIKCIVQMSGLWFTKSRFGVVWKVYQIKTINNKDPTVCLFDDASEILSEELENVFPEDDNDDEFM